MTLTAALALALTAPSTGSAVPPPDEGSPEECTITVDGAQMTCDGSVTVDGAERDLVDVHVWKIKDIDDGSVTVYVLCDYGNCGVRKPQS